MGRGLTDLAVKGIKAGSVRREIRDESMPGLYLIVQTSGLKSWALRFRFEGRTRKYTIGQYPGITLGAARSLAQAAHVKIANGIDPGREKVQVKRDAKRQRVVWKSDLFEDAFDDFYDRYVKVNNKRPEEQKQTFAKHFIPRFRGRTIHQITKQDVIDALDEMVELEGMKGGANRAFSKLRKFFNWLIEKNRLAVSPCKGVVPPVKETKRTRKLSDEELYIFWLATEKIGYPFGPLYQLLLFTVQRMSEISDSVWSEYGPAYEVFSLPGVRSKNGEPQEITLPKQARSIIRGLPRQMATRTVDGVEKLVPSKFLFTTTGVTPVSGMSRAREILDREMLKIAKARAEERGEDPDQVEIEHFTIHDLRRTATSGMAKLGVPPHVAEAILNHTSGIVSGVAAVYNQYQYDSEKTEALQTWADHVDMIVAKYSGKNVVELRASK
jgi:integrase